MKKKKKIQSHDPDSYVNLIKRVASIARFFGIPFGTKIAKAVHGKKIRNTSNT